MYDTTGSYAIENPERVEHLIVMLPKDQMAELARSLQQGGRSLRPAAPARPGPGTRGQTAPHSPRSA